MKRIPGLSGGVHAYHGGFNSRGRRANSKILRGVRAISGHRLERLLSLEARQLAGLGLDGFIEAEPVIHEAFTDPQSRVVQRAARSWARRRPA